MSTAITLSRQTPSQLVELCDEHEVRMTTAERRLLKSAGYKAIKDTDSETLLKDCRAVLVNVMRDLGIQRAPDAYDGARFMDVLREYFSDMTIVDVKQAFEMYLMGALDEQLPRGKDGQPFSHFQQFSASFYVKVLKAYQQTQREAKRSIEGRLSLSLMQKNDDSRDKWADLIDFLRVLKGIAVQVASGQEQVFVLTGRAEAALTKARLLPKQLTATEQDIGEARRRLSRNRDSAVRDGLNNAMEKGLLPTDLASHALSIAAKRLFIKECETLGAEEVAKRFDDLIQFYTNKSQAHADAKEDHR